jgi:serine/threonine protein kinase
MIPLRNLPELYLSKGLLEADLHQIISLRPIPQHQHFQYFLYQPHVDYKIYAFRKHIHRDLKPGNLLINSDCELRICDFACSWLMRRMRI